MLDFESEYAGLMTGLWDFNKSIWNPHFRRDIGKAIASSVPKFPIQASAESTHAAGELQGKGHHVLGEWLPASEVAEVHAHLRECRLYDGEALSYRINLVDRPEFALQDKPDGAALAYYKFEDVARCAPLVRLACHETVVAAAASYLGCTPTISAFSLWHSFPGEAGKPAENFHRDRDCFNFVKLFAYLSPVDSGGGPHQYVQLSHSPDALQVYFNSKGMKVHLPYLFEGNSRNLDPAKVEELFGRNVVSATGPAGLAFLEDSYGLNRDLRPQSSPRLMFAATYSGLAMRFANENDRTHEMARKVSFAQAGLAEPTEVQRYLFRFFLA